MSLDLNSLRLPSNFNTEIKTVKELTTIPVRKPKKLEFFRVREGDNWTFDAYLLDMNEDEEKYLVASEFQPELLQLGLLKPVRFYFLIAHSTNIFFISDITLPDAEDKINTFNKSRLEHYERGKKQWIKIVADRALGAYNIFVPKANLPEPEWPMKPANIGEALQIAFKDKYIESNDHPILKKIRGEA